MTIYSQIVRPLLFKLEPESAHRLALTSLRLAGHVPGGIGLMGLSAACGWHDPRLETKVLGLNFANPVGLAAGYDKEGVAVQELAALGFGHVEVGTVSRLPQAGNPLPRVFRLPVDEAVINRMGFPNRGAEEMETELRRLRPAVRAPHIGPLFAAMVPHRGGCSTGSPRMFHRPGGRPVCTVLGVSIGKGHGTPLESAAEDYCYLVQRLGAYADYLVVNISSPNTAHLRRLQAREALRALLQAVIPARDAHCPGVPLLIKIAPDLTYRELDDVLEVAAGCGVAGIVATNTALGRDGLRGSHPLCAEYGGLSGVPLRARSTELIRHIYRRTAGSLPIIGVGGIDSVESALEKIQAGASLVQLYTGLIYRGPGLVLVINRGLSRQMEAWGAKTVAEQVGTEQSPPRPRPLFRPAHPWMPGKARS